jgi:uncharacterized protein YkwD
MRQIVLSALILSAIFARPAAAQDAASVLTARINALRTSQGLNALNYNAALSSGSASAQSIPGEYAVRASASAKQWLSAARSCGGGRL